MPIKIKIPIEKVAIRHVLDIYELMQVVLRRENKLDMRYEHFWVIALNNDNKILSLELVSMGTPTRTAIEPMQVLKLPAPEMCCRSDAGAQPFFGQPRTL